MWQIDSVPEPERRGMGKQDIHISAANDSIEDHPRDHLHDPQEHLKVGELMVAVVVAHLTAKTCDDELVTLVVAHPPIDELAAERLQSDDLLMKRLGR